jgi:hypothetical protein
MALTPLIVGRLDEGLRREIKEGNQARGVNTSLGGAGRPEATEESSNGRPAREEDETDSSAPLGRETRGRRPAQKREPKGKTYSREDATDARARWAGHGSESSGLAGPEAEWAARSAGRKIWKKEFLN